jgi:hypothetical protein
MGVPLLEKDLLPWCQSLAQLESVLHRLAQPETAFAISISRFRVQRLRSQ